MATGEASIMPSGEDHDWQGEQPIVLLPEVQQLVEVFDWLRSLLAAA